MHRLTFDAEQLQTLRSERLYNPDPQLRVRYEIIYLKYQGVRHEEIARIVGLSRSTVQRRLADYRSGELEAARPQATAGAGE